MATAIIDMSDLVSDADHEGETPDDPPRIQLGDVVVELPPFPTSAFLSASANYSWANTAGSEVDVKEANARLLEQVAKLAGPLDGKASWFAIYKAIIDAYKVGEDSASSD